MERFFIFGDKNTFYDWDLVLTSKEITPPEPKTNYVALDGMSGTLDLSEALTGEITYNDRQIKASFWTCEGSRKDREKVIQGIVNYLHGKKVKIIEPDDTDHYFYGRIKITSRVNTLTYAEISIECTCEPWRYSINESVRVVSADPLNITNVVINNNGAKSLTPIVVVTGDIEIIHNEKNYSLTDGTYQIPDVKLYQGVNVIGVTGSGSVTFSYREAEL
jgi:hypothetical protein